MSVSSIFEFDIYVRAVLVSLCCFFYLPTTVSASVDITAVLGNKVISTIDIIDHASALRILYGVKDLNEAVWRELAIQAVNDLTDIVILESKLADERIPSTDDAYHIDNLRKSLKMDEEQFVSYLAQHKVRATSIALAMRIRSMWQHVIQAEVDKKAGIVSSKELADFTQTIKRNMIVFGATYTVRHLNMSNVTEKDAENINSFIRDCHSCDSVDQLSTALHLPAFSGKFSNIFKDFSPDLQLALAYRDEGIKRCGG